MAGNPSFDIPQQLVLVQGRVRLLGGILREGERDQTHQGREEERARNQSKKPY